MVMAGLALTAFAGFALVYRWTGDQPAGLLTGVDVRVQYAHADAPRARAGAASLRTPARAARDRSPAHDTANARRAVAGAVDGRAGVHVRISRRVCHCHAGHRLAGTAARMAAVLQESPADACARGGAGRRWRWRRCGCRTIARQPNTDMVRSLNDVADYSASLKGYLAAAGTIHFSTWSARLLPGSRGQFLSRVRRNRPRAVRAVADPVVTDDRQGRVGNAREAARHDAACDRRRRDGPVARHPHAGLRVGLRDVPADARA